MICAKSKAPPFSALLRSSGIVVATCIVGLLPLTSANAQSSNNLITLSSREIAVLDSVTCGYIQGKWIPGRVSSDGYFTSLQNQISIATRQLKNAKARGTVQSKINRLNRRLKSLRKSLRSGTVTCRTIGTEPDNFGTPTYSPTSGSVGQNPALAATATWTQTPRPSRTATVTPDESPTETPRPTRTPAPDESATPTPRPTRTATPSATPTQNVAIKISLVDPCSNGPVSGFDPIPDGSLIDLQEVPANANVVAEITSGNKSQVQSFRIRVGSNDPVIVNSSEPVVAYEPGVDPLSPHQPIAGDIYPGSLPNGTFLIRAAAFSGLDGAGSELASSQITVTVTNTDISSKSILSFADYAYGTAQSTPKIYAPQETTTGCIRAGISDGTKVAIVDISNHDASGFDVELDVSRNWTNGKVGIGYDGEVAVVSPVDSEKFDLGFYEPNRSWKFGGEVLGIPLEIDTLGEPVITLQYLFVSGFGFGATFGGTSSFLIDHLHNGDIRKVDIMGGPFPSAYLPDNFGGLYGVVNFNSGTCDPGYLFHITEDALVAEASKRFADISIAPDFCLQSSVADVANHDLYVAGTGAAEDGSNPRLIISRYDRGLVFNSSGVLTEENPPVRMMSVTLPHKPGIRDITVLEDGEIAVLFHEIDPGTVNYSVTPLSLDHTIAFYGSDGLAIRETTVALPFAASGIKAITGGKLVLYGPNKNAEQLTNGQAHIAVVY